MRPASLIGLPHFEPLGRRSVCMLLIRQRRGCATAPVWMPVSATVKASASSLRLSKVTGTGVLIGSAGGEAVTQAEAERDCPVVGCGVKRLVWIAKDCVLRGRRSCNTTSQNGAKVASPSPCATCCSCGNRTSPFEAVFRGGLRRFAAHDTLFLLHEISNGGGRLQPGPSDDHNVCSRPP